MATTCKMSRWQEDSFNGKEGRNRTFHSNKKDGIFVGNTRSLMVFDCLEDVLDTLKDDPFFRSASSQLAPSICIFKSCGCWKLKLLHTGSGKCRKVETKMS